MLQNIENLRNKIGFVFHHGWGHDCSYWKNIAPLFNNFRCVFYDAGYFENKLHETSGYTTDILWVGIGHSIGFAKLLEKHHKHKIKLSALVGIQSFVNFLGNDRRLNKNRSMILNGMISAFKESPIQVLKEFRKNSGFPDVDFGQINFDLLLQDLEHLKTSFAISDDLNTLIIASKDDPIVDNTLINDNFSNNEQAKNHILKFINCNTHTLGYDNPKIVYDCIMNFVKDVI